MSRIPYAVAYKYNSTKCREYSLKSLQKLSKDSKDHDIFHHLYCPTKGCKAKLVFHKASRDKNEHIRPAYLSTWPKSHHKANCILRFEYFNGRNRSNDIRFDINNNDDSLRHMMDYATKKMGGISTYHRNHKRNNVNKCIILSNNYLSKRPHKKNIAKIRNNKFKPINKSIGKRFKGNLRYCSPDTLNYNITNSVVFFGYLKRVKILQNRVILTISWNNNEKDIESLPSLLKNNPYLIKYFVDLKSLLYNKILNHNKHLKVTCLINVKPMANGEQVLSFDRLRYLHFPEISLRKLVYIFKHN